MGYNYSRTNKGDTMYAPAFGFGKDGTAIVVVIIVVYVVFSVTKGYISARKTRKKWKKIHEENEIILKEMFDEMDKEDSKR